MSNLSKQVVKWKRKLSRETPREVVALAFDVDHNMSKIVGIEDLAFQMALYLVPKRRNPSSMKELMSNLMFVSKPWHKAFSLVRAQMRYDYLTQQLSLDDVNQWLYHKIVYIPGPDNDAIQRIPPEGCLRIFRSHVNEACKEAMHEYRFNRSQDENASQDRRDSRPDYYFKAHREYPICLDLVPPKALSWNCGNTFSMVNEIEYDQKPRLVSEYWATIDDVNGISYSPGSKKSKEGRLSLGFHEIISVRDSINARIHPRPPLNEQGQDTSEFLRICNAKALDAPRWLKFAHVVGEDRCRLFVRKNLLPVIGPRPTGNTWPDDKNAQE